MLAKQLKKNIMWPKPTSGRLNIFEVGKPQGLHDDV